MPEHRVTAHVPSYAIENTDLEIEVRSDKLLLGVLLIRQGSIHWRPSYFPSGFRMKWERFDELMREHGRKLKP
jgi:hypothetical protein